MLFPIAIFRKLENKVQKMLKNKQKYFNYHNFF